MNAAGVSRAWRSVMMSPVLKDQREKVLLREASQVLKQSSEGVLEER